jgi:Predicted Zn-dependent peptidases
MTWSASMQTNAMTKKLYPALLIAAFGLSAGAPRAHATVAQDAVRADLNGIDTVVLHTTAQDVVTVAGSLPAGDDRSPAENVALATLTGAMLDKGTTKHDKFAIAQMLGDVGATVGFSVGPNTLQVTGKCLRKDLPLLLSLLAEQLRLPAFSEQEFAKLQKQIAGSVRQQLEDTDFRADDDFSRAVYPTGHPNRQPTPQEILAAVEKTTVADLRRFHSQYYGTTGMRLVIVGDVDPKAAQASIGQAFEGWKGGSVPPAPPKANALSAQAVQTVYMPDKTNVSVVIGQPTQLRYADPDAIALRVGTRILGVGFTGRLMATVRDKEGLTYGIGATVANDTYVDGDWRIEGNFAPALLDKGIASTKRELASWHDQGVTAAELTRAKSQVAGTYLVRLSTTGGMAATILQMLNAGMPLSFVDEYPHRVAALTLEDVNGAIKRHLDPAKMVLVQAGTVPGATQGAAKP